MLCRRAQVMLAHLTSRVMAKRGRLFVLQACTYQAAAAGSPAPTSLGCCNLCQLVLASFERRSISTPYSRGCAVARCQVAGSCLGTEAVLEGHCNCVQGDTCSDSALELLEAGLHPC